LLLIPLIINIQIQMQEIISPKTISRLNWALIYQSPITPRIVYALNFIEGVIVCFYGISIQ